MHQAELDRNIRYARLVYSIASMLPGYSFLVPVLQYQSLPEKWVDNKVISPWGLFEHCEDTVGKIPVGWRNNQEIQSRCDEVWYTVDLPFTPPKYTKKISIRNISLLTKDQEIVDFIADFTTFPCTSNGGTGGPAVIDLVSTVLDAHLKGQRGDEIIFKHLQDDTEA